VLLDGCDTRHLAANELRAHFGVVPQETILFCGSILDNLLLANPLASFEMAVQAAKLAEIHATIEAFPAGYKTDVGERGGWTFGRSEAASRDRPRAPQAAACPHLRRGDQRAGQRGRRAFRGNDRALQGQGDDPFRHAPRARAFAAGPHRASRGGRRSARGRVNQGRSMPP
jgi:hypothetical protein